MHKEILSKEQVKLLPIIKKFNSKFGLVGGTAIALQIGHRESIDFDLFSNLEFNNNSIKRKVEKDIKIDRTIVDKKEEYTFLINGVKFTFYLYPFNIEYSQNLDNIINMPDLITLAAMKAYALGRRAKWKDYVDLYFIIRDYHSLDDIIKKTKEIFGTEFNVNMFKSQLSYFDDVSYNEEVVYKKGFEVSNKEIQKKLIEYSLN